MYHPERRVRPPCWRHRSRGQAMVEYAVVTGALITALLAAPKVIDSLEDAIKNNYKGYSYAVSLSEYPDYLPANQLTAAAQQAQDMWNEFKDFTDPSKIVVPGGISLPGPCSNFSSFPTNC